MELYEAFISSVLRVLREGRRGGARDFYSTGDLNAESGLMCTDEKDIEELNEMYGPLCWQGYDEDPGGFKKLMWYRNSEGVQLQGHTCMARVREGKRNSLYAQTTWRKEARMEIVLGLDHWAEKER